MENIGFWKIVNSNNFTSSVKGLTEEQVNYLKNLKVGDRLVLFVNDVREGEKSPNLSLKRSNVASRESANA